MADKARDDLQDTKREPPDQKGEKPFIPKDVREPGGTDAEKAGDEEQRVNIGKINKPDHNL